MENHKETAKRIYNAMSNSIDGLEGTEWFESSKKCSITAVQMIRENAPLIATIQQYWIDVENEINKL